MTEQNRQPHNQTASTKKAESFYFDGFRSPTTTAVPDEFFDFLAPRLSEAELRVLLYIMRRTFGFKKHADSISLSQLTEGIRCRDGRILDEGTGLSKPAVLKGVAGLVSKGIIEVEKATGYDGRNQTNIYKLRFADNVNSITNYNTTLEQSPSSYSNTEYTNNNYQQLDKSLISPDPRYTAKVPVTAPHTHQPVEDAEQNRYRHKLNGASSKQNLLPGDKTANSKPKQSIVNNLYPNSKADLPLAANNPNESANSKAKLLPPVNGETNGNFELPLAVKPVYQDSKVSNPEGVKPVNLQQKQNQKSAKTNLQSTPTMLLGNIALVNQTHERTVDDQQHALLAQLVGFGLQAKTAEQLLAKYDFEYISHKLTLIETQGLKGIKNPVGFLCWALENDYQPAAKVPFATAQSYLKPANPTHQEKLPAQPKVVSAARRNHSAAKRPAAPLPVNSAYRGSPSASDATSVTTRFDSSRRTAVNAGSRVAGQGVVTPTDQPIFDYTGIWQEVCRTVSGKLGRADLATLLSSMRLVEIKSSGENLLVFLQPAEAWQKRLLTSNAVALIELALSQQLIQACQAKFI